MYTYSKTCNAVRLNQPAATCALVAQNALMPITDMHTPIYCGCGTIEKGNPVTHGTDSPRRYP
jgi:hypothetical protein